MYSTMTQTSLRIPYLLERAEQLFPQVEVISRRPDRSLHTTTYGQIGQRSRSLASALLKLGIRPGERVATLMWNHYAHHEAYFAVPGVGAVLHTLNLRLHPDDIAWIADHAQDRVLIIDDVLLPLYEQFQNLYRFEYVIVHSFSGKPVPPQFLDYDRLLKEFAPLEKYVAMEEDAPAGMCYTSGTTGRPKGVVYSHRSTMLHTLASSLPDGTNLSVQDTVLPAVPMFHVNAWGLPYSATMVGARIAYPGPHLDPENLLDLMAETQTTFTAGVPTVWMGIAHALENDAERWALQEDLRIFIGGSSTPTSLIEALDSYGLQATAIWGMTETSPLASISQMRPEQSADNYNKQLADRARAGLPLPLVDVQLMNDDGVVRQWDDQIAGELQVRGPWITQGYYDPSQNEVQDLTKHGWFPTGDVATISEQSSIRITDRTKDLIKSGGEWISSVELENEIMAHPDVLEAAVIGVAHPKWMERPLAVIVTARDEIPLEEIREFLKGKVADFWLPDGIAKINSIPRTSTGKFQKKVLRDQFSRWNWD